MAEFDSSLTDPRVSNFYKVINIIIKLLCAISRLFTLMSGDGDCWNIFRTRIWFCLSISRIRVLVKDKLSRVPLRYLARLSWTSCDAIMCISLISKKSIFSLVVSLSDINADIVFGCRSISNWTNQQEVCPQTLCSRSGTGSLFTTKTIHQIRSLIMQKHIGAFRKSSWCLSLLKKSLEYSCSILINYLVNKTICIYIFFEVSTYSNHTFNSGGVARELHK